MATTHTPGPWAAELAHPPAGSYATIRAADDAIVCHVGLTDEQDGADARLIAAAPDLLTACEAALVCAEMGITLGLTATETLRAAIAKAKGE